MTGDQQQERPIPGRRWETFVWPRWLPVRARRPMIAQLAAAAALIAAVTMPGWSEVAPSAPAAAPAPPARSPAAEAPPAPKAPEDKRPAHLNLDVRHRFRRVDLTVTVDGKRALETRLDGGGRKFGVFGSREERQFTRSIALQPGGRVVSLQVRSTDDKFDHTRVERFDLGAAAVATMRIGVDRKGLDVMTDRPPAPPPVPHATAAAPPAVVGTLSPAPAMMAGAAPQNGMAVELYQTLRRLLIAMAGFIASVAAAYLFEEFLKSRNVSLFANATAPAPRVAGRTFAPPTRSSESDADLDVGLS